MGSCERQAGQFFQLVSSIVLDADAFGVAGS